MLKKISPRFMKFLVVGVFLTAGDFLFFYVLHERMGFSVVTANLVSYGSMITIAFFIHRVWTFKDSTAKEGKRVLLSLFYGYVGLFINTLIVWLLAMVMPAMAGKAVAVIFVLFYNYLTNKLLVFKVAGK
jgi:putative flippase GtrA